MTRINVIPPHDLADQHLIAEYRELPRVFALARAWVEAGKPGVIPDEYTLGKGHVRFFYPRTGWLAERQAALIAECLRREYGINHTTPPEPVPGADASWEPTEAAIEVNLARLRDRVASKPPRWYRYGDFAVSPEFYTRTAAIGRLQMLRQWEEDTCAARG